MSSYVTLKGHFWSHRFCTRFFFTCLFLVVSYFWLTSDFTHCHIITKRWSKKKFEMMTSSGVELHVFSSMAHSSCREAPIWFNFSMYIYRDLHYPTIAMSSWWRHHTSHDVALKRHFSYFHILGSTRPIEFKFCMYLEKYVLAMKIRHHNDDVIGCQITAL